MGLAGRPLRSVRLTVNLPCLVSVSATGRHVAPTIHPTRHWKPFPATGIMGAVTTFSPETAVLYEHGPPDPAGLGVAAAVRARGRG